MPSAGLALLPISRLNDRSKSWVRSMRLSLITEPA